MIKEAFLICALALPFGSAEEYKLLADIAKDYNASKILLRKGFHKVPDNAIKAPIKWHGFTVYFQKSA